MFAHHVDGRSPISGEGHSHLLPGGFNLLWFFCLFAPLLFFGFLGSQFLNSIHSCMGKPKHYRPPGKKKEGNAVRCVTRSQAIKILQVSLSDFRSSGSTT